MIHQQESLDREAEVVNTWYRRYGQVIYRRCLRLLGDLEDSEDAIQTIFLKVLKRLEKSKDGPFRPDDPLKYLYRTATNVCLNKIRSNGRRPEVPQDELVVELASSDRSFTERFEDQEYISFTGSFLSHCLADLLIYPKYAYRHDKDYCRVHITKMPLYHLTPKCFRDYFTGLTMTPTNRVYQTLVD